MGRRSTIDRLPAELRAAVDIAVKAGATIEEIVAAVGAMGGALSKSAVGRYTKRYAELARRQREVETLAKSWAGDFADPNNPQMRMLLQFATTVVTNNIVPELEASGNEDSGPTDWKTMAFMTRTILNLASARKLEAETESLIRKNERERCAVVAAAAAKRGGASKETIEAIKRDILGLGDPEPLVARLNEARNLEARATAMASANPATGATDVE